ncbi:MAG: 7-cyano-7-deazaguanine synthase [Phycisphaerales bacterium]
MNPPTTLVMSSGGLRSLVATATIAKTAHPASLFIHDGRAAENLRCRAFLGQADHFEIKHRIELQLPHLHTGGEDRQIEPLAHLQMLTVAAGQAAKLGAGTLIWPVSVGEHFDTLAAVAESLVLLEHAVQLETGKSLKILTPLIELSIRQVVELGRQMQLPWQLTRTCTTVAEKPCEACAACLARAEAFAALGFDDPLVAAKV